MHLHGSSRRHHYHHHHAVFAAFATLLSCVVSRCSAYIPPLNQQLGIYSQAPAAGYFAWGAPQLGGYGGLYRKKRSYGSSGYGGGGGGGGYGNTGGYGGNSGYGGGYGGGSYGGGGYGQRSNVGTSLTQLGTLPYGQGSTNNLYGSSGTNSYNPTPFALGANVLGTLIRKKRSYGSSGGGYGNSGYGNGGYGNNGYGNNGYGNSGGYGGGYGGSNVGTSLTQLGTLPYGQGSTNNLYGSSGTNSYNPTPFALGANVLGTFLRKKRSAYIPPLNQQLGIYSQAPAAGYFAWGAPQLGGYGGLYRKKRDSAYNPGTLSVQPVYYAGKGTTNYDNNYRNGGYGNTLNVGPTLGGLYGSSLGLGLGGYGLGLGGLYGGYGGFGLGGGLGGLPYGGGLGLGLGGGLGLFK